MKQKQEVNVGVFVEPLRQVEVTLSNSSDLAGIPPLEILSIYKMLAEDETHTKSIFYEIGTYSFFYDNGKRHHVRNLEYRFVRGLDGIGHFRDFGGYGNDVQCESADEGVHKLYGIPKWIVRKVVKPKEVKPKPSRGYTIKLKKETAASGGWRGALCESGIIQDFFRSLLNLSSSLNHDKFPVDTIIFETGSCGRYNDDGIFPQDRGLLYLFISFGTGKEQSGFGLFSDDDDDDMDPVPCTGLVEGARLAFAKLK